MSDKYYRLVTFVVDICTRPLREFFLVKAASDPKPGVSFTSLDVYLQARKGDINALHRRSAIRLDQYALIYPVTGKANIADWDVTLLITMIHQLFKRNLQSSELTSINGIRDVRNKLQHLSCTGTISDKDFNTYWTGLEHAALLLANTSPGCNFQQQISEEINQARTENMPGLCNVLKTWYCEINLQLQHHIKTLEEKVDQLQETLDKQSAEIMSLKKDTKTSKTILSKASSKRKGRSGIPEKRMKIVDIQVERMKDNFTRVMSREILNGFNSTNDTEVSLIGQQLQNNHRVIVSGHNNDLTYKCALAAVYKTNYESGRCVEISNPVDWKRICPEDADVILFREPFGRSAYDSQKVEVMLEEFDNMLDSTDEDNDDAINIIIVANQSLLKQVTERFEHEMLDLASTVFIESDHVLQGPTCLDEKVDHLQEMLEKQSSVILKLREDAKTSSEILTDVCCKTSGRFGVAEKRIRTVDTKLERMKENLMKSLTRIRTWDTFKEDHVSLIQRKLQDDHRVVISGQNNNVTFKYALCAIRQLGYRSDRCIEINDPADWRRVRPEDVDLAVFREPFGRAVFDEEKVEVMFEVLDDILEYTNADHDGTLDIVIVANQKLLERATLLHKHEIINTESTVILDPDDEAKEGLYHTFKELRVKDEKKSVENICGTKVTLADEQVRMQQLRRFEHPKYTVGDEISVQEATDIIVTLGTALEKKYIDYEQIAKRQKDHLEKYELKETLFGKRKPISNDEYFEFYKQCGIDIDGRQQILEEYLNYVEESIATQVKFAKIIQGFANLALDDQSALIKASLLENELTQSGMANELQLSPSVITMPWNKDYHVDEIEKLFPKEFIGLKMKRLKNFKDLDLNHEEIALVKALIITFPDRCFLEDATSVEHIHNKLIACLHHLLAQRPPAKSIEVQKIPEAVFSMRELATWNAQILQDIGEKYPVAELPLVKEFYHDNPQAIQ